jgi:hypothetical protein
MDSISIEPQSLWGVESCSGPGAPPPGYHPFSPISDHNSPDLSLYAIPTANIDHQSDDSSLGQINNSNIVSQNDQYFDEPILHNINYPSPPIPAISLNTVPTLPYGVYNNTRSKRALISRIFHISVKYALKSMPKAAGSSMYKEMLQLHNKTVFKPVLPSFKLQKKPIRSFSSLKRRGPAMDYSISSSPDLLSALICKTDQTCFTRMSIPPLLVSLIYSS